MSLNIIQNFNANYILLYNPLRSHIYSTLKSLFKVKKFFFVMVFLSFILFLLHNKYFESRNEGVVILADFGYTVKVLASSKSVWSQGFGQCVSRCLQPPFAFFLGLLCFCSLPGVVVQQMLVKVEVSEGGH